MIPSRGACWLYLLSFVCIGSFFAIGLPSPNAQIVPHNKTTVRRLFHTKGEYHEVLCFTNDQCCGKWLEWSPCTEGCWAERSFSYAVLGNSRKDCPDFAMAEGETEYWICNTDNCPLANREATTDQMEHIRNAMFSHSLSSSKLRSLGYLFGEMQILIQALFFCVLTALALVQHSKVEWMPDMGVAIPVAAIAAGFVRWVFYGVSFGPALNEFFGVVVARVMNDVLIPISIFEGAYHCQQLNFYSQFFTGVFFAVFGTLLSAVMIAAMVHYTGEWGLHPITRWRECFAYAAFIADVDPVATLSIFSSLKVDALLSAVVAGEATLNDPIALVIFGVCNAHDKTLKLSIHKEGGKTIVLLAGSITIGIVMGLVLTRLITVLKIRGKGPLETMYVFQCAYYSFVLGEYLNYSGIIVTLFCGLVMGIYTEHVVADHAAVASFINNSARFADLCMFLIIGLTIVLVDDLQGIWLGLLTILFCFVARAVMIALLVPVVNVFKRVQGLKEISPSIGFMMFHSGLRGGMTVMMALTLDPYWMDGMHSKNTMVTATIITVIGMCYLCGCTGPFFLRLLGVTMGVEQQDGELQSRRTFLANTNRVVEMMVVGSQSNSFGPTRAASAPGGLQRAHSFNTQRDKGPPFLNDTAMMNHAMTAPPIEESPVWH